MNIHNNKALRVLSHIAFWTAEVAIFTFIYGASKGNFQNMFFQTLILLPFQMIFTYFVIYFLIPKFLLKRKFIHFFTFLFISSAILVLMQGLAYMLENYLLGKPLPFKYLTSTAFFLLFMESYLVVSVASAIKLVKNWFINQQLKNEIENRQLKSELELLKNRVNPHFLFNTLNNINTLVFIDQQKTYHAIIQLSELMRYMIYEGNTELVPIAKEIEYINNYVNLERLRLNDENFVEVNTQITNKNSLIAPFLFIPFIENAFKYCYKKASSPGIKIDISSNEEMVTLQVYNKINPNGIKNNISTGGFGISNAQQRLQLIYPDRHQLSINNQNNEFLIQLNLIIKK